MSKDKEKMVIQKLIEKEQEKEHNDKEYQKYINERR